MEKSHASAATRRGAWPNCFWCTSSDGTKSSELAERLLLFRRTGVAFIDPMSGLLQHLPRPRDHRLEILPAADDDSPVAPTPAPLDPLDHFRERTGKPDRLPAG
jgi:hypothetical protein